MLPLASLLGPTEHTLPPASHAPIDFRAQCGRHPRGGRAQQNQRMISVRRTSHARVDSASRRTDAGEKKTLTEPNTPAANFLFGFDSCFENALMPAPVWCADTHSRECRGSPNALSFRRYRLVVAIIVSISQSFQRSTYYATTRSQTQNANSWR